MNPPCRGAPIPLFGPRSTDIYHYLALDGRGHPGVGSPPVLLEILMRPALRRRSMALGAAVACLAAPAVASAISAADILSAAQRASNGQHGGQCKIFVNQAVASASGGRIQLSRYHAGFKAAGAVEVDLTFAGPGDIIQVTPAGSTEATVETLWRRGGPLHSAIVVNNRGDGSFDVIDSNWDGNERVSRHVFNPTEWASRTGGGGIIKVWRFGASSSAPVPEGGFVRVAGTSGVYRIAGGAPLPITSWESIGTEQRATEISWQLMATLPAFPADGTVLQAGRGGPLYRVKDGIPSAFPGGRSGRAVVVDPIAIANAGGPGAWSRLRTNEVTVTPKATRLALVSLTPRARKGQRITTRARASAGGGSTPAGRCTLQRRVKGVWINEGTATVNSANGNCTIRSRVVGSGAVRVTFLGATGWGSSITATRALTVR